MRPIFASFTEGERRIIVFVFITFAVGYGLIEWQERAQSSLVFDVSDRPQATQRMEIPVPAGLDPATGKVDVNVADAEALETLPGIGSAMAAAILHHRATYGPLMSVDDLDKVPGIGPAKLAALAPRITFGESGAAGAAGASASPVAIPVGHFPPSAPGGGGPGHAPASPANSVAPAAAGAASGRININTATAQQLEALSGVGPALAQRIIEDRQAHGPYRSPADLDRVRGIGPSILSKNAHLITTH